MANDLLRGRQTVVPLTNKSGGGVVAGDVVILSSADAGAFITTTTAAQTADWVGVALETIANNASGRVLLFGYAPIVNLASSASLGDYIRTHTSAKQAQRFGTGGTGDFGQVLGTGTGPAAIVWGRPDQGAASGLSDPMTTAGDMVIRDASNVTARLAAGAVGQVLAYRGGTPIPTVEYQYTSLNFLLDGGGATITTGIKGDLVVDFDCTIVGVTLLADQTGSAVVDIWKDSYSNYPPTGADSITASAKPTISSATKSTDTTLTGWTTSISAGDVLRFNVDSCSSIQRLTLALKVRRA